MVRWHRTLAAQLRTGNLDISGSCYRARE